MEKGYMQSQTIVGAIKLIVPLTSGLIAAVFGLDIKDLEQPIIEVISQLVVVVFTISGIYDVIIGRLKATKSVNIGVPYIK
jgi:hypothetical protein